MAKEVARQYYDSDTYPSLTFVAVNKIYMPELDMYYVTAEEWKINYGNVKLAIFV